MSGDLSKTVDRIATEVVAAHAAAVDRGEFPTAAITALREAGLPPPPFREQADRDAGATVDAISARRPDRTRDEGAEDRGGVRRPRAARQRLVRR